MNVLPRIFMGAACLALAATAHAARFNPADVPYSAAWYAHLDVDALRTGELGRGLLANLDEEQEAKLRFFKRVFGFDLVEDLHGLTLFGIPQLEQEGGVIVMRGEFSREQLLDLVRINPEYDQFEVGAHRVHTWLDENKGRPAWGVFIDEGTLLIADRETLLRVALDRVDGRVAALEPLERGGFGRLLEAPVLVGLANMEGIEANPEAAFLQSVDQALLQVGESGESFVGSLALRVDDPAVAESLERIVGGFVALVGLNQENPELAELAKAMTVTQAGEVVEVSVSAPTATIVAALLAHSEQVLDDGANRGQSY